MQGGVTVKRNQEKKAPLLKKTRAGKPHLWQRPRLRYGAFSTLLVALVIASLLALNAAATVLERKNGWRIDFSFNALTTTGEETRAVLDTLEHPVHVYALFEKGEEDEPLMELLDRYAALSPLFTWEQTSPSLNPALLSKFSGDTEDAVTGDSLIVYCEATDRWRILSPADFVSVSYNYDEGVYEPAGITYESKLTNAIVYVQKATIKKLWLVQGHHELDEATAADLIELLENNDYEVDTLNLNSVESIDPADVVLLLSPVHDLMDAELTLLTTFIDGGGSLLITCDYTDPVDDMPNYQSLLRYYGITPKNGIVVASADEPGTYYNNIRIDLLPTVQSTDMTYELVESGTCVLLLAGSRAFTLAEETDRSLDVAAVLTSGSASYLKDVSSGMSLTKEDGDETGAMTLAARARRVTESGNITRCVVLGCSTLLTSSQLYGMTNAEEFILTVADYLSGGSGVDLNIAAKAAIRPQLSAGSVTPGAVVLVLLPVSVIIAAVIVLVPRRRRSSEVSTHAHST